MVSLGERWRGVRQSLRSGASEDLPVPSLLRLGWLRQAEGLSRGHLLRGYLLAILLAGAAAAITKLLEGSVHDSIGYLAYLAAVGFSAWYGGLGAALAATAASALIEATITFPPIGVPIVRSPAHLLQLALFLFDGILVSAVTSALRRVSFAQHLSATEKVALLTAERRSRARAEQSRTELERLQAVTASLAQAATPEAVAQAILDRGLSALGATAGAVGRVTHDWTAVELIAARVEDPSVRATSRYALDGKSHIGDALRQRRPILIPDHATWVSRYGSAPRLISGLALDDGASATVPLLVDDRTLGVLVFDFAGERVFDDDTRELIDRLGDQCAQALDRANAYVAQRRATARLARSEARLTWLAHASEVLTSSLDNESTIDEIARLAVPSIATWCVIELLGPPKQLSAVRHPSAKEVTRLRELIWLAPDTLGAWLAGGLDEGTLVQRDRTGWSRTVGSPRAAELLDKLGVRSCVVAPIVVRRGIVGAITLGSSETDAFDPEDLAVAQDLAARVGTSVEQATLHGAVSQFKATVDAMLDAVFLYDPQTLRLTYVNRGAAAIAASTGEELLGVRITDLQPNTTEDAFRAQIHPLLTGEVESSTSTTTIVRSDGGQVPVSTFTQCIRLPDGSTTMILTARDIREQIDAQAQLARIARDERQRAAELGAVLEGMREGVLVVDRQGAIQLANHAALEIIGARAARYADIGDLLSVSAQSLPPLGEMTTGRVLDIPDGRSIEWSIYPTEMRSARTDEDDARSSIVMLRDVTRQRVADQAREAFIDVLSHELRTPITTIFGYAKILQRPHHGLDVAEVIGDVEIEADRLYRIVEDLLALSRMESGLHVDGEPLLLQHIVPSVIEHEARRWPGVAFEIDLPHDLPAASGEQTYVEQVLRNLLSNAAKYGHANGEETCAVTVTGSATATEVTVTVLDRGVGIDESEARRLFDLYYRSPSTARLAAGGGIGLFVCRGLVTAMGGHIWGRRRDGGGSEFGFSLPRGDEDAEPQHPSPEDEVAVHHG